MPPKGKKGNQSNKKPLLAEKDANLDIGLDIPQEDGTLNEIDRLAGASALDGDLSDSEDDTKNVIFHGFGTTDMSILRYTDSPGITPMGTPTTEALEGSYVPHLGVDNNSTNSGVRVTPSFPQDSSAGSINNTGSNDSNDGDDVEAQSTLDALQTAHPVETKDKDTFCTDDLNLLSGDYYGIVHNYLAVGFYYATVSGLLYPIFRSILGLRGYQLKGASTLQTIWWSFKVAFGCLSDTIPIAGYRRKWYVFGGWLLAGCAVVCTMLLGQPSATSEAWPYIMTFSAQNLAYIVADVAMDGFVCDLAKHESEQRRGRLQLTSYFVRSISMAVAALIMSFGFSSKKYGGSFSFGIELWHYLLILLIVNALGLPFYLSLKDKPNYKRKSYLKQLGLMYDRLKLEGVYRVCIFSFTVHVLAYVTNVTMYDIEKEWCGVEPYIDGIFNNVLSNLCTAGGIYITKKYFLNVSWKKTITWSIVGYAILTYIPQILIDTATIRSQYFFGASILAAQVVMGIFFMVCSFAAVEVAEKGFEAITYGLLTTISNLSGPFTTLLSSQLAGRFDLYDENDKLRDDARAREQMLILDSVIFVIQLCAILAVFIIPKQKKELRLLIESGKSNPRIALAVTIGVICCMAWSLTGSMLQIFPATSCLVIVGGKGC